MSAPTTPANGSSSNTVVPFRCQADAAAPIA
jgi:hypothetical protein